MSAAEGYIPYETLARAEVDDMILSGGLVAALGLDTANVWKLRELLADAYAQGIDMGFALCDFAGDDVVTVVEAYNAGAADALEKGY